MEEPAISFNQAALKVKWSEMLIQNLHRACAAFIQTKPYHIAFEPDAQEGRYFFKAGLTREIPPEISLLMGDICGNIRASLDYAWMGVVRKENPDKANKTTLPFADNRQGLISTVSKSSVKASAKEVEILLVDRIKSHRDFANGGNQALCALNGLSNWNKHNLLIVAIGVTEVPLVKIGHIILTRPKVHGGIGPGLIRSGFDPTQCSYEGEPTVDILFGGHEFVGYEPVIPTLVNLAQAATQALQAFCDFFPDAHNPRFNA